MPLLSPGSTFPALSITQPGGTVLALPAAFAGDFGGRALLPRLVVPVL
jgi:hypothetical protein